MKFIFGALERLGLIFFILSLFLALGNTLTNQTSSFELFAMFIMSAFCYILAGACKDL